MNGFGGRGFEKDFESLFQSSHQNIGQLIAFVFQEHRAHGFVLSLKETLDLIRHIIVLFFTGSSRPWEE
ncbi:hypothetical protein ACCS96_51545, partial [Rhizobium ruizarguesonis]